MKKSISLKGILAMVFAVILMLGSFSVYDYTQNSLTMDAASKITMSKKKTTVYAGSKFNLSVSGTTKKAKWSSSNKKVATVTQSGKVTAKKKGTATITAKIGKTKVTCKVTVRQPVKKVKLNKSSATLNKKGKTLQLKATASPSNANKKTITWKSSNTKVATVTSKGKVKAVGSGTCYITATAADRKKVAAKCKVTVNIPAISKASTTIYTGKKTTLKVSGAGKSKVTWSTSNKSIATVSSKGVVTGKKKGTVTITAKVGGTKLTSKVTVLQPATGVKLNSSSLNMTKAGQTATLKATVSPGSANDKSVAWKSSNTRVATVNGSGVVKAVGNGSCTITATTVSQNKVSASCKVNVSIAPTGVTLNATNLNLGAAGQTAQLSATVSPGNAANKTVTWSSSNNGVATVSANGLVTAVGNGSCTITAKTGSVTATCKVNVNIAVTGLGLNTGSLALNAAGQTAQLTATVNPGNAANKTVTWASSNNGVATVSANGLVTAVGNGTCNITAAAGGFTAACTVTVSIPETQPETTPETDPGTTPETPGTTPETDPETQPETPETTPESSGTTETEGCVHDWVPQYETVFVPGGEYLYTEHYCRCGQTFRSLDEWSDHVLEELDNGGSVNDHSEYGEDIYSENSTVEKLTGYTCSKCGATKSAE